jgi:NitT/TauT family transport system ATP-binding protein
MTQTGTQNANQNAPALHFQSISKRFAVGPPIIQNLSVDIAPGEFVSIIGPSGCGKSTLLKLVAGLSSITSGKIEIDGRSPTSSRKHTAFIFQDPTLLPWCTVRSNIGLPLDLASLPRAQRDPIVDRQLALVGLDHVANHYPRQLSGGMKMRVSIARALASSPRLVLLDEPFAALDEITRDRLNEELLRLRAEHNWTVLFVTHSVAEAVFLSDRVLVLAPHPGRLAHDIPIPLPFPRTAETRASAEFDRTVAQVSRTLRLVEAAQFEASQLLTEGARA